MTSVVFVSEKDYFTLATCSGNYFALQRALSRSMPGCVIIAGPLMCVVRLTPGSGFLSQTALGAFSPDLHSRMESSVLRF